MKDPAALLVFLGFIALLVAGAWMFAHDEGLGPRKKKGQCVDTFCDAFRWPSCSDGRCRYHCGNFCKCIPRPEGKGELHVFKGGKGA